MIEGITIDKFRLIVELQPTTFQRLDTQAKLLVAADDPAFLTSGGDAVFLRSPIDGQPAPPRTGRLIESSNGMIYATIVKSIKWDGKPFPDSEIDGNIVIVPDFGRIYFGELLISTHSRSLTMVRLTLGPCGRPAQPQEELKTTSSGLLKTRPVPGNDASCCCSHAPRRFGVRPSIRS